MSKAIYLSSPYSHEDSYTRVLRFEQVCAYAASLMCMGHIVFSPVAHSHPISHFLPKELLLDHDFWMHQDIEILLRCSELWVLKLPGWEESKGVAREVEEAKNHDIPVIYIEYSEDD